jgi:hypothetical protein
MLLRSIKHKRVGHWLSVPWVLLVLGLGGCGSSSGPTGKVDGQVTLDGQPVPTGTVVMFQEGPEPFSGVTGADGKFTIGTPVKVGSYVVAVQQIETDDRSIEERKKPGSKPPVFQNVVPEKYRNAQTSGVKFDVKEGDNNKFELDMSKKGGSLPPPPMPAGGGKGGKGTY